MAGFGDLIRIWLCLNVIGLPRFKGHGQRTGYWLFGQRLEERSAFFRSVCSWVKDQMARAPSAGVRTVGAASDATTTIRSGALEDALI